MRPGHYLTLLDLAMGSFSFITDGGVKLTHDYRKLYNNLILAREWSDSYLGIHTASKVPSIVVDGGRADIDTPSDTPKLANPAAAMAAS